MLVLLYFSRGGTWIDYGYVPRIVHQIAVARHACVKEKHGGSVHCRLQPWGHYPRRGYAESKFLCVLRTSMRIEAWIHAHQPVHDGQEEIMDRDCRNDID